MKKNLQFKNDTFKKNRGGYSRWLALTCDKCKAPVLTYQKDGPGMLKRLYLDRIISPGIPKAKTLNCKKCKTILGVYTIYEKEKRPAYRLFVGALAKKIVKGNATQ